MSTDLPDLQESLAESAFNTQNYEQLMDNISLRAYDDLEPAEKVIAALAFSSTPMSLLNLCNLIGMRLGSNTLEFMNYLKEAYGLKITIGRDGFASTYIIEDSESRKQLLKMLHVDIHDMEDKFLTNLMANTFRAEHLYSPSDLRTQNKVLDSPKEV